MGIFFESLDESVREFMTRELDLDIKSSNLYISPRLTKIGSQLWPELLREALYQHDDDWLASQLRVRNLIQTTEERRKPTGGFSIVQVPITAPDTLAEGEFNRFYVRGLCAYVLEAGGVAVEVYRGKEVRNPRSDSQAMLGRHLPAQKILEDLRSSPGVEPALGLPPGPNSGLTVRRIEV